MSNKKTKKRIGIDARFYGPLGKGLGRYVQEVVDNIVSMTVTSSEFEYVIFLSPDNFKDFKSSHPNVRKIEVPWRWYSWREQLFFPLILKKEKLDLVHFPHFNVPILTPVPFVVTIHDLILTRFSSRRASMLPAAFYWFKQAAYRLVIRTAIRRARAIITVSEFTRRDIIKKFKANPKKLFVTYEGVADLDKKEIIGEIEEKQVLQRYRISEPFLLYVGNAYPHKNLEVLLTVFNNLLSRHHHLKLVMVGKDDYFYHRVKEKASALSLWQSEGSDNNKVIFPGYVPDADLAVLYRRALFYVFPSLYEGFGLPPLEAMSHSCPVVSSNQASLPEVIGDAALYFDPYNQADMLSKLEFLFENEDYRQQLIARGLKRVNVFSWQKCARQTLEIYRKILVE
ncbi:MAG TPA: glycosyltransferase family 1 protein [bacterium]|nr:glycosyltransferase family 1 protein [bacterium]HQO11298.1 glycosyltransferase family 1 protein [bacterium]HQQ38429.1 glycosyltransferase family 1 protein [bacterium]